MDGLTITTGVWPAAVLVSVIINAVATPLVLRAYRAAALRGMSQGMPLATSLGSAVDEATSQSTAEFQPPPIAVRELNDADLCGTNTQWREARRRIHRAQWAQAMAGS